MSKYKTRGAIGEGRSACVRRPLLAECRPYRQQDSTYSAVYTRTRLGSILQDASLFVLGIAFDIESNRLRSSSHSIYRNESRNKIRILKQNTVPRV